MARFCILLLLVALSGLAPAADQSELTSQVTGIHKFWKSKSVNGHPTALTLGDFLKIPDADYQLRLTVFISTEREFPVIDSSEIEVTVLDEMGKSVPVKAGLPRFFRTKENQFQTYELKLKRGQKVSSIHVRWKASEQSYSISEGEDEKETITL